MSFTVKLPDGSPYTINELLGDGDSNTKLRKSGPEYLTYGLSLSPANESGYQTCASSSPGCRAACLFTAGLGRFDMVRKPRIAKTIGFFEQRRAFTDMLFTELRSAERKGIKQGKKVCVRLNIVSDIMWEKVCPTIFTTFPDIQFYDYTKHFSRMINFCNGIKFPANYHLTFSRSEENEFDCETVLLNGGNITVVFKDSLPKKWCGYRVIDGDKTDLRFTDPKNVIVGLKAKGQGKKDTSGFVVSLPLV
jgi:hypothetical protein